MSRSLDNYKKRRRSSGAACANLGISASQARHLYYEWENISSIDHILPHGIQVGHIPAFWNRVSEKELTETPKVSPARVFASSPAHMIEKPFPRYTHFVSPRCAPRGAIPNGFSECNERRATAATRRRPS